MVSNTTQTITIFRTMRETSSPLTSRLDECCVKEHVVAVDVAEVVGRQQELTHCTVRHGEEDHCGTRRRHFVTRHCSLKDVLWLLPGEYINLRLPRMAEWIECHQSQCTESRRQTQQQDDRGGT